jgi:hypothetical protein
MDVADKETSVPKINARAAITGGGIVLTITVFVGLGIPDLVLFNDDVVVVVVANVSTATDCMDNEDS